MIIQRLTTEETKNLLDIPYNPPIIESEEDRDRFEKEYFLVIKKLRIILERMGEQDEDFNLDSGFCFSRGIGFETMSYAILTKSLIPSIQEMLQSLDHDYEIRTNPTFWDGWTDTWDLYIAKELVRTNCPDKILELLF